LTDLGTTHPAGELVWLDPATLVAHPANIREDHSDTDLLELTASVAARGVLEPLIVVPDSDGHRILAGHRRCAAAISAQVPSVPCIVRADLGAATDQVITMLVENTRRRDLTVIEEARGYAQLALAGLSAAKIAKATGTKATQVKRSLTVTDSQVALATAARYALSLDQALAVAEFDSDTEAVKLLVVTASNDPQRWDHVVGRLRADRDTQVAFDAAVARLTEAGLRVVAEDDLPEESRQLSELTDADAIALDATTHAICPGHVVVIDAYDPDQEVAFCIDPGAHGHHDRYAHRQSTVPSRTGPDGKLTEEAKADRRAVIEGNRAWRAAREVRMAFLRELLARKTAPNGTLRYAVETVVTRPERVGDGSEDMVTDLLGVKPTGGGEWSQHRATAAQLADQAVDARLPLVLLAQVAADAETAMHDHAWREDRPTQAARWLTWLAGVGYQLADIEAKVVAAGIPAQESD
jgi:ParB family chromosome partitioning protein